MANIDIKIVRFDESNRNIEALKGQYGQNGQKDYSITVIKNVAFVVVYDGGKLDGVKIPTCYRGFLITNKGRRIETDGKTITCTLDSDENAQGTLIIKKWN